MQRLAEVRLAQGRSDEARQLLDEALLLARWSTMGMHLLQRIFGTLIASAPDPQSARVMVDRAESTLGEPDQCWFCTVMLAVPAATACARVGDLEDAHRFLASAARSVSHWGESSWQAAVIEAQATVALAEGDAERLPPAEQGGGRRLRRRRSRRGRRPVPGRGLGPADQRSTLIDPETSRGDTPAVKPATLRSGSVGPGRSHVR